VIALLSCLVAAIFQNHPIARIDGNEKRRRLELVSNFSHFRGGDDPAAAAVTHFLLGFSNSPGKNQHKHGERVSTTFSRYSLLYC